MSEEISLWEALEQVPDPRSPLGRRYPLPGVLSLVVVAILGGSRSLYAIAQYGQDRGAEFLRLLGLERGRAPCCASLHYLFKALDAAAFEAALGRWLAGRHRAGWRAVRVDGKTLRGTTGRELPGVHLLAAYAPEAAVVLAQLSVGAKTNEHKAALELLNLLPMRGRVISGDAMFCQRDLSKKVLKKGATTSGRSRTTSPS